MKNRQRIEECCDRALASWSPLKVCPECGRSLAGLSTWADELNAELRRRPTPDDREPEWADRDDDDGEPMGGW